MQKKLCELDIVKKEFQEDVDDNEQTQLHTETNKKNKKEG
jgi:hypothetical protein